MKRRAKRGEAAAFIEAALATETDSCILWPFGTFRGTHGEYGGITVNGRMEYAARIICRRKRGEPPTAGHYAAHSCRTPLCINHRHLRWATNAKTLNERHHDGTIIEPAENNAKLHREQVQEIRASSEQGIVLAAKYGVSQTTISQIRHRRKWRWLP